MIPGSSELLVKTQTKSTREDFQGLLICFLFKKNARCVLGFTPLQTVVNSPHPKPVVSYNPCGPPQAWIMSV